ncbi:(2Fe-2S)-binding protein [Pseudonocardia sp. C8]|nr:(2Fe-2S)-binding protein [Pseudonocardia sp. C8]
MNGETVVRLTVNGEPHSGIAEPRTLLSDFLRHTLGLTGTHVGCEQGACGACTVRLDGEIVRSCITFAVAADGAEVETVEGLAGPDGLHPIQEAFRANHGLQCGFCTPGMLLTTQALLEENPAPTDGEIREHLSGNVCRCTGYQGIVAAVKDAAGRLEKEGRS